MPRKRKNELPSGSIRKQVYDHSELVYDAEHRPVIDPRTGKQKKKRIYISVTGICPEDVKIQAISLKQNKEANKYIYSMTLRQAINKYINDSGGNLSESTLSGYNSILNYAFQSLLDKKLKDIDKVVLREAVTEESKRIVTNRKIPRTISEKTLKNEYGLITSVLIHFSCKVDTRLKLKAPAKKFRDLPSAEQIFNLVKGTRIELPVLFAMWMSFTMSEILGLTKDSISSDGNYIMIKQVLITVHSERIVKEQAKEVKRNRKHRIPEYIKELISKVDTHYLVPLTEKMIYGDFCQLQKKSKMKHITFHDLRHVCASVMVVLNIPQKYLLDRGGWESSEVAEKVYEETFEPERVKADNAIDNYFNQIVYGNPIDMNKYRGYLALFGKEDCNNSRREYEQFLVQMQHEMQHDIQKAP